MKRRWKGIPTWFRPIAAAGIVGAAACDPIVAPDSSADAPAAAMAIPLDTRIVIRLHAVLLSDDDGTRGPNGAFTRVALRNLVRDDLNPIFAQAGIKFEFNPWTGDWTTMRSTLLNNADRSNPSWEATANSVAAGFPDKLVVFFRWGSGVQATGNGFGNVPDVGQRFPPGWSRPRVNRRFAVMPSQWGRVTQSAVNNRGAGSPGAFFAHELGHHLGLFHPMPGTQVHYIYGTTNIGAQTDAYLLDRVALFLIARGAGAFDGDLLADTPPDPGWPLYRALAGGACAGVDSVTGADNTVLSRSGTWGPFRYSYRFKADRSNVMGYYNSCAPVHTFSPMQIERMRNTLVHPNRGYLVRRLEPNPS